MDDSSCNRKDMTAVEINSERNERLLLLCRMVIDQAKMGEDYLILFLKRDRWDEFRRLVEKMSDGRKDRD